MCKWCTRICPAIRGHNNHYSIKNAFSALAALHGHMHQDHPESYAWKREKLQIVRWRLTVVKNELRLETVKEILEDVDFELNLLKMLAKDQQAGEESGARDDTCLMDVEILLGESLNTTPKQRNARKRNGFVKGTEIVKFDRKEPLYEMCQPNHPQQIMPGIDGDIDPPAEAVAHSRGKVLSWLRRCDKTEESGANCTDGESILSVVGMGLMKRPGVERWVKAWDSGNTQLDVVGTVKTYHISQSFDCVYDGQRCKKDSMDSNRLLEQHILKDILDNAIQAARKEIKKLKKLPKFARKDSDTSKSVGEQDIDVRKLNHLLGKGTTDEPEFLMSGGREARRIGVSAQGQTTIPYDTLKVATQGIADDNSESRGLSRHQIQASIAQAIVHAATAELEPPEWNFSSSFWKRPVEEIQEEVLNKREKEFNLDKRIQLEVTTGADCGANTISDTAATAKVVLAEAQIFPIKQRERNKQPRRAVLRSREGVLEKELGYLQLLGVKYVCSDDGLALTKMLLERQQPKVFSQPELEEATGLNSKEQVPELLAGRPLGPETITLPQTGSSIPSTLQSLQHLVVASEGAHSACETEAQSWSSASTYDGQLMEATQVYVLSPARNRDIKDLDGESAETLARRSSDPRKRPRRSFNQPDLHKASIDKASEQHHSSSPTLSRRETFAFNAASNSPEQSSALTTQPRIKQTDSSERTMGNKQSRGSGHVNSDPPQLAKSGPSEQVKSDSPKISHVRQESDYSDFRPSTPKPLDCGYVQSDPSEQVKSDPPKISHVREESKDSYICPSPPKPLDSEYERRRRVARTMVPRSQHLDLSVRNPQAELPANYESDMAEINRRPMEYQKRMEDELKRKQAKEAAESQAKSRSGGRARFEV